MNSKVTFSKSEVLTSTTVCVTVTSQIAHNPLKN